MEEIIKKYFLDLIRDLLSNDTELILLVTLLVMSVMVLDAVSLFSKNKKQSGITLGANPISIDGSKSLPVKNYVSQKQLLAGRPDAVIIENGYIIPVERKPLANKIRDRYVAQLLVYMRLIEEFEKQRPPYGYLILGSKCRRIKIENSKERQDWLQNIIDEMRSIIDNKTPAIPTPVLQKCKKCDVRNYCDHCLDDKKIISLSKKLNPPNI